MILSFNDSVAIQNDKIIPEALGAEQHQWSHLLSSPPALVQYRNIFIRELK